MKVGALLKKKMDELNQQDFDELAIVFGTQFGLMLHEFFGVMPKNAKTENLFRVLKNLDVIESKQGILLLFYDASPAALNGCGSSCSVK